MPTYDYLCTKCGKVQEEFHKIDETPMLTCKHCESHQMTRRPSATSLSIHGDGFYSTMYGKNKAPESSSQPSGGCCPCGKNKGSCSKG